MPEPDRHTDIYAAAHTAYWDHGWRGILPVPPRTKRLTIVGYTGNHGTWPSYADTCDWADMHPDANIALRLPENIIGIDVDNYHDKTGHTTLQGLEAQWGTLPPTWRTTSRNDGVSGIRLYRIPAGLRWPGQAGPAIDIIRHAHRYALVWPSIHPEGGTYRWITPTGEATIGQLPTPDELPPLPPAWVTGLTGGTEATDVPTLNLTTAQARDWLQARPQGDPCRAVQHVLQRRLTDLATTTAGRHETMLETTQRLAYLAAEGHTGVPRALAALRATFTAIVTRDGTRDDREAGEECDRAITGAVRRAAAGQVDDTDPCTTNLTDYATQATPTPAEALAHALQGAPPGPTAPPVGQEDTGDPEQPTDDTLPPSWRPVDLTPYLDGTWSPTQPTMLARDDGTHLIYPGLVHDLHGESESGKSLVAQAETATRLTHGDDVLYVDFESDAGQVVHRLLAMGATPTQITAHLTYVRPEASPYALVEAPEWAALLARTFTLAVLDGVTDALGMFGAATKENDDIAAWHRAVPRMLARRTGAAVVLVDHVVKNTDTRGRFAIGGQAKMAAIDGASYSVEIIEPLGKGIKGVVALRIGKDRPGEIRAHCGAWRSGDRSQEAARITIDSTTPGHINVHVAAPETTVADRDEGKEFKPTGIMEKLSRLLEAVGEPMTKNGLEAAYKEDGGKARRLVVLDAINRLIAGGWVVESAERRGGHPTWEHARSYRQSEDPESDAFEVPVGEFAAPLNGVVPTGSRLVPGTTQGTGSPVPPPKGEPEPVTPPKEPPLVPGNHPPKSEYRYDYRIGEYVHPTTGELWDGD